MGLLEGLRWSRKTTNISPTDTVVFIVGPSGSGKSRFMDILLQNANVRAVRNNKGQRPGTTEVYAERCRFEGMPSDIVLVDTPSFHTYEDPDGEETLKKWMDSRCTKCKRAVILYTHDIASNPHDENLVISRHLEAFRRTLPRNLTVDTVHVVPTMAFGAKLPVEKISVLMDTTPKSRRTMTPFNGRPEVAWDVVRELLNHCEEREWKNLGATIEVQKTRLEADLPGQPEHYVALVKHADLLLQRYQSQYWHLYGEKERKDDLDEIITLRRKGVGRAVLELTPSGHQQRFAHLVNLANSLDQRFQREGITADLEEIIPLRRAALECSPPAPSDQCISLINLANCLREKVETVGGIKELNEAIAHASTALALSPPGSYSSSRDCLASCVELKIQNIQARTGGASSRSSSSIKETIWKIVGETVKSIPLRLLNTRTGILCNRVAQLSNFEGSREYKQLLASASKYNGQELEALIRKAVISFFQFVTLSHRWGDDEPLLRDIEGRNVYGLEDKTGLPKLQKFCLLALKHEYVWAWSDTCCIDKESSAEVQEAIGSMFFWYRQSALTIVHLSDVFDKSSFTDSAWFKRGWTLQELLAPRVVLFYTRDWSLYMSCRSSNHKTDSTVLKDLQKASGIGEWHLENFKPGMDDARSRLQWASGRRTTRPEDVAYSLFGVFDLHLPVLYGESADKALGRLLAEIISQSGDVSVLDWVGEASSFHSCFPANLTPYQTMPCARSTPGDLSGSEEDLESARKLWSSLADLPSPSIHQSHAHVTVIKPAGTPGPQTHTYEIHASGLTPFQLTLSESLGLCKGPDAKLTYILVRPWHSKSLDVLASDDTHAPLKLLQQLAQPFNALLLVKSRGRQYKRIAADCTINCRTQDLPRYH
ncbi:hypothetical protein F5J12DRAFT_929047 [Pisolithus orientalis]|uniref:uncharacterized protein n=1 Tax=Pisolithus orientalis TaxID=936130 RepID=UPI002224459F|nr:uncharacterized protein F5J12DRAFT_929047 [Pisolithus orientalis]KAI5997276.1 hypothetical protein F5J12DRAFT_929047 [Pisolithus orientalis]